MHVLSSFVWEFKSESISSKTLSSAVVKPSPTHLEKRHGKEEGDTNMQIKRKTESHRDGE